MATYTETDREAFYDLISQNDQHTFTRDDMEALNLDYDKIFAIARDEYHDPNLPLNVYIVGENESVMSFDPIPREQLGETVKIDGAEQLKEWESDISTKIQNIADRVHSGDIQDDLHILIDVFARRTLEHEPVIGDDGKYLPPHFEGNFYQPIVDAYVEQNKPLIDISKMTPDERSAEMQNLKDAMDAMSDGAFSRDIEAETIWLKSQKNHENKTSDQSDASFEKEVKAMAASSDLNDIKEADPEFAKMVQRFEDLRNTDDPDGRVQTVIKELQFYAPEVLGQSQNNENDLTAGQGMENDKVVLGM